MNSLTTGTGSVSARPFIIAANPALKLNGNEAADEKKEELSRQIEKNIVDLLKARAGRDMEFSGATIDYTVKISAQGKCTVESLTISGNAPFDLKPELEKALDALYVSAPHSNLVLQNTVRFYDPIFKTIEENAISPILTAEMQALGITSVNLGYSVEISPGGNCKLQEISIKSIATADHQNVNSPEVEAYLKALILKRVNGLSVSTPPLNKLDLSNSDLEFNVPRANTLDLPVSAQFKEENTFKEKNIGRTATLKKTIEDRYGHGSQEFYQHDSYLEKLKQDHEKWLLSEIIEKRKKSGRGFKATYPAGPLSTEPVCFLPSENMTIKESPSSTEKVQYASINLPQNPLIKAPPPQLAKPEAESDLQEKLNAYLKEKLARWVENPVEKKEFSYKLNWLGETKVVISNAGNVPENRAFYRTLANEYEKIKMNFPDGLIENAPVTFDSPAREDIKNLAAPLKLSVKLISEDKYEIKLLNQKDIANGDGIQTALNYAALEIVLSPEEKAALKNGDIKETIIEINPRPALVS